MFLLLFKKSKSSPLRFSTDMVKYLLSRSIPCRIVTIISSTIFGGTKSSRCLGSYTLLHSTFRLYDFPRLSYIREWELVNCDEHDQLIKFIRKGEREKAVCLWQESHWSFKAHEKYIREFYSQGNKQIQYQLEINRYL